MNKNKLSKWIIGAILLALLIFLVFKLSGTSELDGESIQVQEGDIATYYNFSGSIEAKNKSVIYAEQTLQIKEFLVKKGQVVEKGDILYLSKTGQEVESKISGEVLRIEVEEDAQINPGREIIEIVDFNDLELKVRVDEYDLNSIDIGTQVEVTVNALDKTFQGQIIDIAKQGTYMNGVTFFESIISIESEESIRVGMSAEAKVLNEESKNTAILPMKAIKFKSNNIPYVNIIKEDNLEEVEIEIGITDGINVEILSGLKIGDEVFIPRSQTSNFGPPPGVGRSDDESGGGSYE